MTIETETDRTVDETGSIRSQDEMFQIVSFRVGDEEYGVEIMRVQEIILIGQITEMPQVPSYVRGLINLRGLVIPVIDLRARLGFETQAATETSRIIVVNVEDRTVGVVVDAVNEVLRLRADQVETAPTGIMAPGHQFISGLVRLEDRILLRLNVERLLSENEAEANPAGLAKETTSALMA